MSMAYCQKRILYKNTHFILSVRQILFNHNHQSFEQMGGEYEVEKILERRQKGKVEEFKVKWKGYGYNECTWEPQANLSSCRQLLQEFKEKQRNINGSKSPKPIQRPSAGKSYKSKQPEKPKMKKRAVDDEDEEDDIYREDEQDDELEDKSARKLKRPGQQLSNLTAQSKKTFRGGKMNGAGAIPINKHAQASEETDEEYPEDIPSEGNKLGDTKPKMNPGIEILAMFHNDKNEYCYKVREKGAQTVITREKLLGKDPVALVLFYESKIKIGLK